ncbi:hypothetical protein LCGC14_2423380 [marine sediment metagenome]|uniref:Uncharacterized protein n=1 Tax=marine sediment metagenome TaxID=412755 RepID=A0A0F9BP53_9ZZZZ
MNGGMTECSVCDCDPCQCERINGKKVGLRIKSAAIVLESLWQAVVHLPRWRMRMVKWIWPDFTRVLCDFLDYYWEDGK